MAKARRDRSPRHLEWVKVKHGDSEENCFGAYPPLKHPVTAHLVTHESRGLTDWERDVDQLAEAGYLATKLSKVGCPFAQGQG